jgi:hypothetical protein
MSGRDKLCDAEKLPIYGRKSASQTFAGAAKGSVGGAGAGPARSRRGAGAGLARRPASGEL